MKRLRRTAARYQEAFNAIGRLPKSYLAMLRFHYRRGLVNAPQMAKAAGYRTFNAANLHYGLLGRRLEEYLGANEDTDMPTTVLVTFKNVRGQWHWRMRPSVATALKRLHWV